MFTNRLQLGRLQPTRPGFTLIEAVISLVIVGVILVASLSVLGTTARMRRVRAEQDQGLALAQSLLTEILAARFEEPDDPPLFGRESSESGGDRARWDDIDDYDGWSASPPEDKDGVVIPGLAGWEHFVAVANVAPGDLQPLSNDEPDPSLRLIAVGVRAPDGSTTELIALRSVYGAHEQAPPVDTTYVTQIAIDLVVGADASSASGEVNLVNHVLGGP